MRTFHQHTGPRIYPLTQEAFAIAHLALELMRTSRTGHLDWDNAVRQALNLVKTAQHHINKRERDRQRRLNTQLHS
jgi:hypothetical protein